ncbi:MAG: PKD domain-containing protein, partial [Gammaproteobacteria bacterium]
MLIKTFIKCLAATWIFFFCSAALSQLPGLPVALPGDDTVAAAAGDQNAADISPGNGARLVVWADERANPYNANEYETSSDIYGVRLDADGNPLDPVAFAVTAARGSQTNPKAAWNGSAWLVVFQTTTVSGTGFFYSPSLAAVRVGADGTVLDPDPIPLPGLKTNYAVASNGDGWVVATLGNDVTRDIVAVRLAADGSVLDPPTRTLVPEEQYSGSGIRLAYAGGNYLLTYIDQGRTEALLFDTQLNPAGAPFELLDRAIADLAGNGSEYYIVWSMQRPDFSLALMGSRVAADGTRLDAAGVDISGAFPPFGNVQSVAWDGVNWRAGWGYTSADTLRVASIAPSGAVLNQGGSEIAGAQTGITAGTGTGSLQVVWSDFTDNEYDVYGATVNNIDSLVASDVLSNGQSRQTAADLAAGAEGYMLAYRSTVSGEARVMAQPLTANGVALTPAVLLDNGPLLSGPGSPSVAWNGSVYLASWGTPGGIVAQRIDQSGNVLDPAPIPVMPAASAAVLDSRFGPTDVAAVGDTFLVVGRKFGQTVQIILPIGVRVSGNDGSVLDSVAIELGATTHSPFTVYTRALAVTAFGNRWLAAWHSNWTHDNSTADSIGAFVNADGTLEGSFLLHGPFSTAGGNGIFDIGLSSDSIRALYVQSQELTSGVETDLLMHIVNADGTVQPMVNLTPWPGNQYRPSVSFNGTDYVVVFQDQKNRLAPQTLDQLDARGDLYGMRIAADGTVVDRQGFLIDDSPIGETDLTVASRGSDTLIAASQMLNDGAVSNYRVLLSDIIGGLDRFPVAIVDNMPSSGDAPLSVDFDATGSNDPENSTVTYLWDFADGTTSNLLNPNHIFAEPGEYPVTLTVTDAAGLNATQAVTIAATAVNQPPIAVAWASTPSGPTPLSVVFRADGSYDPDGSLGNIEWRSSDGRTSFGSPAFFTFDTEGTYTVTLRVHDSRGAIGEDTLTIVAGGVNQAPIAQVSATPTEGAAPLGVAFDAGASSDADGSIVSYAWDFGDGSSGTGVKPTHRYSSLGTYLATLTVTDNSGATASASVPITVNAISAAALLTSIDMATTTKRGIRSVSGTVHVVNGAGGPEQSVIVYAVWTLPDATIQSQIQYSDRRGNANFSLTAALDGTYTLKVTDAVKSGFLFDANDSETVDAISIGNTGADTTPPAMPTGLAATPGDTQVSLGWNANTEPDLAGYYVDRATDAAGPFVRLNNAAIVDTQYVDTGLINGQLYVYRIVATDTSGNDSAPSATASATPAGGGTAPTSLHVDAIVLSTVNAPKGEKFGFATAVIVDDNGNPVADATVTGEFTGSFSELVSDT